MGVTSMQRAFGNAGISTSSAEERLNKYISDACDHEESMPGRKKASVFLRGKLESDLPAAFTMFSEWEILARMNQLIKKEKDRRDARRYESDHVYRRKIDAIRLRDERAKQKMEAEIEAKADMAAAQRWTKFMSSFKGAIEEYKNAILEEHRLHNGMSLGDATREILQKETQFEYDEKIKHRENEKFYRALTKNMHDGQRVRDVYTAEEVLKLRQETVGP